MAGWVNPSAMMAPVHSGAEAAATTPAPKASRTSPLRRNRRATAETPAPRNTASPSRTSGVARSVDRMARPAVVSVMIVRSSQPKPDGRV